MHPLEQLDFPTRAAKRAQYEAFEFVLTTEGILVRNCSHPDPSEHEYLVAIEGGLPTECECPADEHYESACKHRVAVAIRRPLLDAMAPASQPIVADGGRVESSTTLSDFEEVTDRRGGTDDSDESGEDCDECIGEFPCWECVLFGRKELPD
ncbi:SWIM zinc finger family protein [Halosimplex aquaticum]|uniref:SWIM zinc finger family protein n=1 Tax=Halosimplex aquaticum TaxID=3026162 RepID=A0ABD5XTM6_9EURY|nr:SWIM zinc finger family protein [Halosimplex aquaticum]